MVGYRRPRVARSFVRFGIGLVLLAVWMAGWGVRSAVAQTGPVVVTLELDGNRPGLDHLDPLSITAAPGDSIEASLTLDYEGPEGYFFALAVGLLDAEPVALRPAQWAVTAETPWLDWGTYPEEQGRECPDECFTFYYRGSTMDLYASYVPPIRFSFSIPRDAPTAKERILFELRAYDYETAKGFEDSFASVRQELQVNVVAEAARPAAETATGTPTLRARSPTATLAVRENLTRTIATTKGVAYAETEQRVELYLDSAQGGATSESVQVPPGGHVRVDLHLAYEPDETSQLGLVMFNNPDRQLYLVDSGGLVQYGNPICHQDSYDDYCLIVFRLPVQQDQATDAQVSFLFAVPDDLPDDYRGYIGFGFNPLRNGEWDLSDAFIQFGGGGVVTVFPADALPAEPRTVPVTERPVTPTATATRQATRTPTRTSTPTKVSTRVIATYTPKPPTPGSGVELTRTPTPTPPGSWWERLRDLVSYMPWWGWLLIVLGIFFLVSILGGTAKPRPAGGVPKGPPGQGPGRIPEESPQPTPRRKEDKKTPPALTFVEPEIRLERPALPPSGFRLVIAYRPGSHPIDPGSLRVKRVTGGPKRPLRWRLGPGPNQFHADVPEENPFAHGEARFEATIGDRAGQTSTPARIAFTVDALVPDLSLHLAWVGGRAPAKDRKVRWRKRIGGNILEGPDPAPTFPASGLLLTFWVRERPEPEEAAGLDRASIRLVADWPIQGIAPGRNLLDAFVPERGLQPGDGLSPLVHVTKESERLVEGWLLLDESLQTGPHCFSLYAADEFGNSSQVDLVFVTGNLDMALILEWPRQGRATPDGDLLEHRIQVAKLADGKLVVAPDVPPLFPPDDLRLRFLIVARDSRQEARIDLDSIELTTDLEQIGAWRGRNLIEAEERIQVQERGDRRVQGWFKVNEWIVGGQHRFTLAAADTLGSRASVTLECTVVQLGLALELRWADLFCRVQLKGEEPVTTPAHPPAFPAQPLDLTFELQESPDHPRRGCIDPGSVLLLADFEHKGVQAGTNLLKPDLRARLGPGLAVTEAGDKRVTGCLRLDTPLAGGAYRFGLYADDRAGPSIILPFTVCAQALSLVDPHRQIVKIVRAIDKKNCQLGRDKLGGYLFSIQWAGASGEEAQEFLEVEVQCVDGQGGRRGEPRTVVLKRVDKSGCFRSEPLVAYINDYNVSLEGKPPPWAVPVDPDTTIVVTLVQEGQDPVRTECPVTIPKVRIRRARFVVREVREGPKFTSHSALNLRIVVQDAALPRRIALTVDDTPVGVQGVQRTGNDGREGQVAFQLDTLARFDREREHRFTLSPEFPARELGPARPVVLQTRSCDLLDAKVNVGGCESRLLYAHQCLPFNPYAGTAQGKAPANVVVDGQSVTVRPGRFYCVVEFTPYGDRAAVRMSGQIGGQGFRPAQRAQFPDREGCARFTVVGQSEPQRLRLAWLASEPLPAEKPSRAVLEMAVGSEMVQLRYRKDDPYQIDEDLSRAEKVQDGLYALLVDTVLPIEPKLDRVQVVSITARREDGAGVTQLARKRLETPVEDDLALAERYRRLERQEPEVVTVPSGTYVEVKLQAIARSGGRTECPAAEDVPLACVLDSTNCTGGYTFVEAGQKLGTQDVVVRTDREGRIGVSFWIPHIRRGEERVHLRIGGLLDLPFVVKRRVIGVFEFVDQEGRELDSVFLTFGPSAPEFRFYIQFRFIGEPDLREIGEGLAVRGDLPGHLSSIDTYVAVRRGEVGGAAKGEGRLVVLEPLPDTGGRVFRSGPETSRGLEARSGDWLVSPFKELELWAGKAHSCRVDPKFAESYKIAQTRLVAFRVVVESLVLSVRLTNHWFDSQEFVLKGKLRVEAPQRTEDGPLEIRSLQLELVGVAQDGNRAQQAFVVSSSHGSIKEIEPGAGLEGAASYYLVESSTLYSDLVHFREVESLPFDLNRPLTGRITVGYRYGSIGSPEYETVVEKQAAVFGATEVRVPESPFNPLLPEESGAPRSFDVKFKMVGDNERMNVTFTQGQVSRKVHVARPANRGTVRYDPLARQVIEGDKRQKLAHLPGMGDIVVDVEPVPRTVPKFALFVRHRKRVAVESPIRAVVDGVHLSQECQDTFANGATQTVREQFAWRWEAEGQRDVQWVLKAFGRVGIDHTGAINGIPTPDDAVFYQQPPRTGGIREGMRTTLVRAKPGALVTLDVRLYTERASAPASLAQDLPLQAHVAGRHVTFDPAFHSGDELDGTREWVTVRTRRDGDRSSIKLRCRLAAESPYRVNLQLISDALRTDLVPAVLEVPYVRIDHIIGPAVVDVLQKKVLFAADVGNHERIDGAPEHVQQDVLNHVEWYVHSHYCPVSGEYAKGAQRERLGPGFYAKVPIEGKYIDRDALSRGKVETRMGDYPLLYVTAKSANVKTIYAIARTDKESSRCPSTVWHVTGLNLRTLGWPLFADIAGGWGDWRAGCFYRKELALEGSCYVFRLGFGAGVELPFFGTKYDGFIQGADCVEKMGGWYAGLYTEGGFFGQGVKAIRAWRGAGNDISVVLVAGPSNWYNEAMGAWGGTVDTTLTTTIGQAWSGRAVPGAVGQSLKNLSVEDLLSLKLSAIYVYIRPDKLVKRTGKRPR